MRKLFLIMCIGFLATQITIAQEIIELNNNQSMCITGKGTGQDGAINPYMKSDLSYGIVENIGENMFSIRIQNGGKIIKEVEIKSKEIKTIKLLKDYEMYFDSDLNAKAKVDFKKTTE